MSTVCDRYCERHQVRAQIRPRVHDDVAGPDDREHQAQRGFLEGARGLQRRAHERVPRVHHVEMSARRGRDAQLREVERLAGRPPPRVDGPAHHVHQLFCGTISVLAPLALGDAQRVDQRPRLSQQVRRAVKDQFLDAPVRGHLHLAREAAGEVAQGGGGRVEVVVLAVLL